MSGVMPNMGMMLATGLLPFDDANAFKITIDTTLGDAQPTFTLPLRAGYNYNFVVDWGDGKRDKVLAHDDATISHAYQTNGTYQVGISGTCESWYFNNAGDKDKLISIDKWGNVGLKTVSRAFQGCTNLLTCDDDTSDWTGAISRFDFIFSNCTNLSSINCSNWNMSSCTSLNSSFYGCRSLISIQVDSWVLSSCEDLTNTFFYCESLMEINVSSWDVSKVKSITQIFFFCKLLTSIDVSSWDVSSCTDMVHSFAYCFGLTQLNVSNWDVSSCRTFNLLFRNCSNLSELDVSNWDTSECLTFSYMFNGCSSLTSLSISNWDTSSVTDMSYMLSSTEALNVELDLSLWDVSKVTTLQYFLSRSGVYSFKANNWNLQNCINISRVFWISNLSNLEIANWNVENIENFNGAFRLSKLTSLDLSGWNITSKATEIGDIFSMNGGALTYFSIGSIDTSGVTGMNRVFESTDIKGVYGGFNVHQWDVTKTGSLNTFILEEIYPGDYNKILISWSQQNVQPNVTFDANLCNYTLAAQAARNHLINEHGWTINDAGLVVDNDFVVTVNTALGDAQPTFTLPLRSGYSYNFTVDWGDGNQDVITAYNDAATAHTYATGGTYQVRITGTCQAWYFNNAGDKDKLISVDNFGSTGFVTLDSAFFGCANLATCGGDNDFSAVTSTYQMFNECTSLTAVQLTETWNVSAVQNMAGMFRYCSNLSAIDLSTWNTAACTNMTDLFAYCDSLPAAFDISAWNVSAVATMEQMFYNSNFNGDISAWDVSAVQNMASMFGYSSFNQPIGGWVTTSLTNLVATFRASQFNQPIGNWDVSKVTSFGLCFALNSAFNQDISGWDTSSADNMYGMFINCHNFNQPIGGWDVSKVTTFQNMFLGTNFNTDISAWVTSACINMSDMFKSTPFNQPIGGWDVSNVVNMSGMFEECSAFTQDLSAWNTGKVIYMTRMFYNAGLHFNIGAWNVTSLEYASQMFYFVDMGTSLYDDLLSGWAAQELNSNVQFHAGNSQYSSLGEPSRNFLTNTLNWTIYDGGLV